MHSKTRTDGARTIDDDKKQRSRSDKWKKTKCARPTPRPREARRDERLQIRALVGRERATAGRKDGRTGASSAMDVGERDARRSSRSPGREGEEEEDAGDDGRRRGRLTIGENARGTVIAWACAMAIEELGSGVDGERM